MSIKWEQFRQARRIHGGLGGLCLAILAVKLARLPIPSRRLRLRLFRNTFARKYPPGLKEQEAEHPLDAYRSFNAVFTRGVKPECRPIPAGTPEILSPCDGTVEDVGRVEQGRLMTVKGIEYSLASLVPDIDIQPYEGGRFAIFFLSPIDCHRVFSPQDGCLEEVVHVPGARLLVHPPFQRAEYPVYTLNERMILRLVGRNGLVRGGHGRRLGCGKHHLALRAAIYTQIETNGVLSVGVASRRQKRRLDWDVRAWFIGCVDHAGIAEHDAVGFPSREGPLWTARPQICLRRSVLSRREYEAGDVSQTVQRTGRTTPADVVFVAGFGNAIAADYATFVTQRSQGDGVVVVDEKIRRLADPHIDWLSMDEFLRSNLDTVERERPVGPA